MKTKAIIFDLDGTLLDTLEDLWLSVNYALGTFGFMPRTRDEVKKFLGNGVRALVECALPTEKKHRTDECLAVFKPYYDAHKEDNTAPYGGIIEMLEEVKAAGLKSAIVSNKYDAAVKKLSATVFRGLIDFSLGEGGGIAPKPAPDGVLLAMIKLGVTADECVYVGDSEVDLLTAKNSGLNCIAVSWGFRDREFLESEGAEAIIDAPCELLENLA